MTLQELHDLADRAWLTAGLQLDLLRKEHCEMPEEVVRRKLELADLALLSRELREHVYALKRVLMVCKAVEEGRYREDWQQCKIANVGCPGCTSSEQCALFDDRAPYTVIASELSRLSPLSDSARQWILRLDHRTRALAERVFGTEGLSGSSLLEMDCDDDARILEPASAGDAAPARAAHDARADAETDSLARRLDQYERTRQRLVHLCTMKGDVHEIAVIIVRGMSPQVPPAMMPS